MSTSNSFLCSLFTSTPPVFWFSDCFITSVSCIRFHHFARRKHWFHMLSADCQIMPFPSRKWAVARDCLSCLDASADAIPQSSALELVAFVTRIKRTFFPFLSLLVFRVLSVETLEINTVMICLACPPFVITKSIFKSNLKRSEWVASMRQTK